MKFTIFMKYWSLVWMSASIGVAIGAIINKDWLFAIFYVISCAINHFCYNLYSEALRNKWQITILTKRQSELQLK